MKMLIIMVLITWVSISGKAGNILRIDPRLRSPPVEDRRNVGVPSGFVGLDMGFLLLTVGEFDGEPFGIAEDL